MVAVHSFQSDTMSCAARKLDRDAGSSIAAWLENPVIVDVSFDRRGGLCVHRLTGGVADREAFAATHGVCIVQLVAHHVGVTVHAARPRVSAELPETKERSERFLPPVVIAPIFATRKPAVAAPYDCAPFRIIAELLDRTLCDAVRERRSIQAGGATLIGRSTLSSALLTDVINTTDGVMHLRVRTAAPHFQISHALHSGSVPIGFRFLNAVARRLRDPVFIRVGSWPLRIFIHLNA
jgi:type IV secretion system protein VirB11